MSDLEPFEVGDWRIEPDLLRLRRGDIVERVEPKAMGLLLLLAERSPQVVSREEILERVWEGRAVVDTVVSRAVSMLRHLLGDEAQDPRYIETIPRQGYRLIAPVRSIVEAPTPVSSRQEASSREPISPRQSRWKFAAGLIGLLIVALVVARLSTSTPSTTEAVTSATSMARGQPPAIVVLPFENLSGDAGDAYLAAGLTEEMIHQLATVSDLRVVSRTSSSYYEGRDATSAEIAEALGVDYLLEGSVLAVDGRLRISAQLIRPNPDEHLFSRSYDRELAEVLALQRQVAHDVAQEIRSTLDQASVAAPSTEVASVNPQAYREYLRGRHALSARRDIKESVANLSRAVELDPTFAAAWGALAEAHLISSLYVGHGLVESQTASQRAIDRALALDPNLASVHASLGLLRLLRDRDWQGSEEAYRRAIDIEPSYIEARHWIAELLSLLNRHDEALTQAYVAVELDPLSPLAHAVVGQTLSRAGEFRQAIDALDTAEALEPGFSWHLREKAWAQERLGDLEGSWLTRQLHLERQMKPATLAQARAAIEGGGQAGFDHWHVGHMSRLPPRAGHSTWMAQVYAAIGDDDQALEWIEGAIAEPTIWFLAMHRDPAFDRLRQDPRFVELTRGLPLWPVQGHQRLAASGL